MHVHLLPVGDVIMIYPNGLFEAQENGRIKKSKLCIRNLTKEEKLTCSKTSLLKNPTQNLFYLWNSNLWSLLWVS